MVVDQERESLEMIEQKSNIKILHKCLVYFKLQGDFDPSQVTCALGIDPTSTLVKGSQDPTRVFPRVSTWEYSLGYIDGEILDIYKIVENIVSILLPYSELIFEVKTRLNLEAVLQVVLWISNDETVSNPAIGFDTDVIKFLAAAGASIDIDTYRKSE
jgi:Domain of unknown function (DUF4279)